MKSQIVSKSYFPEIKIFLFSQGDLDELSAEAHVAEDKAGKAMVDAARLADELRGEQDLALGMEKGRKVGA